MFDAIDKLFAFIWSLFKHVYDRVIAVVTWITSNRRAAIVTLGLIIVIPVAILASMFLSGGESNLDAAWREYFHATHEVEMGRKDVAWLTDLITEGPQDGYDAPNLFKGTDGRLPKLWAFQFIADNELSVGIRLLYTDKDAAAVSLLSALGHYEYILETAGMADGLLQPRALLGQSAAAESLMACNDDKAAHGHYYAEALKALDKIQSLDLDSATTGYAKQRADTLREIAGEGAAVTDTTFLEWLAAFTPIAAPPPDDLPPPSFPPGPGELLPPPVLNSPLSLPELETTPPEDDTPDDPPADDDPDADPADSENEDAPSESQDE
jgi:hypothetical protein